MRFSVIITSRAVAMVSGFREGVLAGMAIGPVRRVRRALLLWVPSLLLPVSVASAQVTFFNDGPAADQNSPFSEAVRVNDLLFISGQVGTDGTGTLVAGGMTAQSHQVMRNIEEIVVRRNLTMNDIVKCTVFLEDVSQWGDFNEIYVTYFSKPFPARSALGANGLALGAALEVECIAAYAKRSETRP